ncbi:MAG: DNA-binding response regulator [Flammeovirgaceae bacterium]|nr:DNA-binding response regulator [Flammeovirgaceae bacterium]MBE63125.1 DNA-binding response regulator [Flammeovirgaceae bacterium]MBR08414.1 DNA-binding response regulator [Rickettsiales bacterium]HCX22038.1 DNA-binding response regulator [Cytophagales bacterium]|tara:strand:- start:617 stop:1357 length:741 start_codon:yes stop_codon:yes gene_type:complete
MRAVIVDDEISLRESTNTLLSIYCPDIEVVGLASGVKEGIQLIKETAPDIAFLDIEMPDGLGFDIVHAFPQRNFSVIFVTGHNEYAVKAFKFSAIDYILKPIDPDDLERAVNKAKESHEKTISGIQLKALEQNLEQKKLSKIVLKDSEKVYLVDTGEIIRCESSDNYTKFFLTEDRTILVSTTLKEYENLFSGQYFFRCHQSHLINLIYFDHYDKREGGSVVMKNGDILPVSVRKKDQLMKALQEL